MLGSSCCNHVISDMFQSGCETTEQGASHNDEPSVFHDLRKATCPLICDAGERIPTSGLG